MKMALSNPGLLSGRADPARFSRNLGFGFSPSNFNARALPLLGQEENGDPDPAPAPAPAPEPDRPDIRLEPTFIFPPGVSMLACAMGDGTYTLIDARTLGFLGRSYAIPVGAAILSPGDVRCGGARPYPYPGAPADRVFVTEPVAETSSALLVGAGIGIGALFLALLT